MVRSFIVFGALTFLGACSSRMLTEDEHQSATPDGGVREASAGGPRGGGGATHAAGGSGATHTAGGAGGAPAIGAGGTMASGAGGASQCPNVYTDPLTELPPRNDAGRLGLTELRRRFSVSRDAFAKYAAAHGDTYDYTDWFFSFTGAASRTKVHVSSGVVTSVTENSRAERDSDFGMGWGTSVYSGERLREAPSKWATMSQLYDECEQTLACKDPRENFIYFQTDARGLLVQCGFFPMNCADDCYEGFGPLLLTADGTDWTTPAPGCCPPSPAPDCCMSYGGPDLGSCGEACDGMPPPNDPGWSVRWDDQGCARWSEPADGTYIGCCGCSVDAGPPRPRDAGTD